MQINYLPIEEEAVPFVELADGLQVPGRLRAEVTDIGLPAVVEIEVAVREGAVACEYVALRSTPDGPPITREMFRDLPIAQLSSALMANSALLWDFSHPGWGGSGIDTARVFVVRGVSAPTDVQDWIRHQTAPKRRRRVTDDVLQQVAEVYRAHLQEGAPTQAVAKDRHVSHSTAARYVSQARQRGLLGPATPGLAGERDQP